MPTAWNSYSTATKMPWGSEMQAVVLEVWLDIDMRYVDGASHMHLLHIQMQLLRDPVYGDPCYGMSAVRLGSWKAALVVPCGSLSGILSPATDKAITPVDTAMHPPVQALLHRQFAFFLLTKLPRPLRWFGGLPHEVQSRLEVVVPQLHFCPLTPHSSEVIHVLVGDLRTTGEAEKC